MRGRFCPTDGDGTGAGCAGDSASPGPPARGAPEAAIGMLTENVEPLPGALTTSMVPPCSSASRLEMASPRPVPWCFLTMVLSPCTNGWNSRAISASSMPGPWSRTQKRTAEPESSAPISTTVCSALNFTALERRFSRIWRSLPRSARTPEDETARDARLVEGHE